MSPVFSCNAYIKNNTTNNNNEQLDHKIAKRCDGTKDLGPPGGPRFEISGTSYSVPLELQSNQFEKYGIPSVKSYRAIILSRRAMSQPPPNSLAIMCLVHRGDPDRDVLERAVYADVKHLLCADILRFTKNLCAHFAGNEDGAALGRYLSALSGIEKGAPAHCDALDQVQLYHLLAFCESPPPPHAPLALAEIPVDGYLESPGKYGFAHAVLQMRHHPATALCALVLGHAAARNSSRLCALILNDDFCPTPSALLPFERWTDTIEAVLMSRTAKFRVSGNTHRMLSLGATFRASTMRESLGAARLMYLFMQRMQSNCALQYTCDKDLWFANIALVQFVQHGPKWASFQCTISCMLMTALGRDVHKVVLGIRTYAAVLLAGNQTLISANEWSANLTSLVNALVAAHGAKGLGGWAEDWARHIAAFKVRCAACLELADAPLELEDWVPFQSALPDPRS
ncbi:hypothetical protein T492DRAFT_1131659 [Pavlovales sp. CCMP2436]|nr:hypothetical protein T492DRAFT_1131659 [Pavlovales sp. CCMP2436]